MNKCPFRVLFFLLCLFLFACSNGEKDQPDTLARINDYALCCREFEQQLAREVNYDPDLKVTREVREAFLEQLIQEELLIQEAKKLKLDRKEEFMHTIERYWKSTLIRDLLELKGKEIDEGISVSQAEIEAQYEKLKGKKGDAPPLADIQDLIIEETKDRAKSKKLREWIVNLKKTAHIEVDQERLLNN